MYAHNFSLGRALFRESPSLRTQGYLAFFETVSRLVLSRLSREFGLGLFTILVR